jgi:uncharacterized protein YlxP (DUF503 family)
MGGRVALMGEIRNAYKVSVRITNAKDRLRYVAVGMGIISKSMSKKYREWVGIFFI